MSHHRRLPFRCYLLALLVVVAAVCPTYAATGSETESRPLLPTPIGRAYALAEPERTRRLELAESLHESQLLELASVLNNADATLNIGSSWRNHCLAGLALALEEYFAIELSYPDSVEHLRSSGILLDGWRLAGIYADDFDTRCASCSNRCLTYVPQPLGLGTLVDTPGRGCGYRTLALLEYSLCIPFDYMGQWDRSTTGASSEWFMPFRDYGIVELLHVDQVEPVISSCADCKVSHQ